MKLKTAGCLKSLLIITRARKSIRTREKCRKTKEKQRQSYSDLHNTNENCHLRRWGGPPHPRQFAAASPWQDGQRRRIGGRELTFKPAAVCLRHVGRQSRQLRVNHLWPWHQAKIAQSIMWKLAISFENADFLGALRSFHNKRCHNRLKYSFIGLCMLWTWALSCMAVLQ